MTNIHKRMLQLVEEINLVCYITIQHTTKLN